MTFTAGIALALATVLGGNSASAAQAQSFAQLMPQAQSVQQYVKTYFADEPVMYAIAGCESHYRQYDPENGQIFRGIVNNKDVGVMQINETYHAATAAKLGLDLYTMQGNAAYAKYLYDREGTAPWSSSEPCWGKTQVAKDYLALNSK